MSWIEPKIDVHICHEPGGLLGVDYNRVLNESKWNWLLFIDHDVLLSTNPNWYYISQKCIEDYPQAGAFTCYCNWMANPFQVPDNTPKHNTDVMTHRKFSQQLWQKNGFRCTRWTDRRKPPGGFFMLLNREKALHVGGFPGKGQFAEDSYFFQRMYDVEFEVYRMDGLYLYHVRDRSMGTFIEEDKTACEMSGVTQPATATTTRRRKYRNR